jgi:hypothetical protein
VRSASRKKSIVPTSRPIRDINFLPVLCDRNLFDHLPPHIAVGGAETFSGGAFAAMFFKLRGELVVELNPIADRVPDPPVILV